MNFSLISLYLLVTVQLVFLVTSPCCKFVFPQNIHLIRSCDHNFSKLSNVSGVKSYRACVSTKWPINFKQYGACLFLKAYKFWLLCPVLTFYLFYVWIVNIACVVETFQLIFNIDLYFAFSLVLSIYTSFVNCIWHLFLFQLLKEFPRDLLSLKRTQILCFYMGRPDLCFDIIHQVWCHPFNELSLMVL